ncbi:MAG TPA: nuclear transport factor 2 family protein, partial [Dehalococcoidia bacterium]|nr:nuclear transport factor 2 family protein [Dehalococcoidia bacterium]
MQQTDPTTATTIGIVQRYNESFNQGDVDGVMAAMTGDCVVE